MSTLRSQWFEAPDLVGDHVKLVQLHPHHAPGVLAASDDDSVFAWMTFERPRTPRDAEALVERYLSEATMIAWAQIDLRTHQLAGLTTYYDINPADRTVAIGHTWLGAAYQRTGINTEAKLLLLGHAFDHLGAVRVAWHTDIRNEGSQTAIERLGGVKEGVLRKHRLRPDDTWRDTVAYSMLDDEWPTARTTLEQRLRAG